MTPAHKRFQPPQDREYRGIPDRGLPIRYVPRDSCYIGVPAPREDVPEYRASQKSRWRLWNWPKHNSEKTGDE